MPSILLSDNGVSSGSAGLKSTADSSGVLALQTTTSGGVATTAMTIGTDQSVTFVQPANLPNTFGFKNRIINGAMMIDQRNAGASVTSPSGGSAYVMDRWYIVRYNDTTGTFTCARSSTAPAGFVNSALLTVTAAQASVPANAVYRFAQSIEGVNVADLGWGTANAQSVTVGFWVRSSVTGTYGGRIRNSANNRSYVFQFTVNSANTFEYKTINITGDTSGTWLTDTGIGLCLEFGLGDGSNFQGTANAWQAGEYTFASGNVRLINTNAATFYITGVQLEKGSTATSFDYRPYGTELALCQRYFYRTADNQNNVALMVGGVEGATGAAVSMRNPVEMRATPTVTLGSGIRLYTYTTTTLTTSINTNRSTASFAGAYVTGSGMTGGQAAYLYNASFANSYIDVSAEL